ncbi:PPOX class probable F420-dependent enzyme [Thermocatellispora tengchongensis]|uniref:PPOX class probable F420-dependent enzyme n=1 Tax=Thermocatellispora tengchongensis TaxID=1073253 RepID=A0A840PNA5_9ACTN|nr:TIGR03668 family PPOX class F420-dependent oxidoreductase [Thermocatellispora tengchongensis]MBB5140366.1 PPOX class probable F420-dependent enzyme [Thermocatellispora tengchongensis]
MRIEPDRARRLFHDARVAGLATAAADATPHLVPVTFAMRGETVYVAVDHKPKTTATGLRRLANIRENPRVCLLTDHYDDDWSALWWVRADGRAEVVPREPAALEALAAKYPQYRERTPEGPVIVVQVEHWSGWSYT